ncbi:MAG: hypothetical protein A3H31_02285 [Gallionellales bacterium RIFCSPLOWO2_02_FULL_57_47]|nr:MAG: hypothetical protein A3H31_02285 [Gallionellales bacterium RIFCSPLOWO2_02_FULL_57_47]
MTTISGQLLQSLKILPALVARAAVDVLAVLSFVAAWDWAGIHIKQKVAVMGPSKLRIWACFIFIFFFNELND